jgi:ABC-type uncharacterized transport system ATPase component
MTAPENEQCGIDKRLKENRQRRGKLSLILKKIVLSTLAIQEKQTNKNYAACCCRLIRHTTVIKNLRITIRENVMLKNQRHRPLPLAHVSARHNPCAHAFCA